MSQWSDAGIDGMLTRDCVDDGLKWRVSDIFADEAAWEKERASIEFKMDELTAFAGKLGEEPGSLLAALRERDGLFARLERLSVYAMLRKDEDVANAEAQERSAKAAALSAAAHSKASFIAPEILLLGDKTVTAFISKEPGLQKYGFYLRELSRMRSRYLSKREERLLALASEPLAAADEIFSMLAYADMKFSRVRDADERMSILTEGRYSAFMESPVRGARRRAFQTLFRTYAKFGNTFAASLAAVAKRSHFVAELRGYGSALEMALDEDNIPEAVYSGLIDAVDAHLPLLWRYMRVRRRALGIGERGVFSPEFGLRSKMFSREPTNMQLYDLYAPLAKAPCVEYPYDEAQRIVLAALEPLGERYCEDLAAGLASGWVDVAETENKRAGAYCSCAYGSHPFVLLNYQCRLDDVLTLAHELGHAMHFKYSMEAQPFVYANAKIFVAEVASLVNESLTLDYLASKAKTAAERVTLLTRKLETIRTTLFRQTMFAEFERKAHAMRQEGGAITKGSLNGEYRALVEKYYSSEVDVDAAIEIEWARIPHFYTPFYVYQYATGVSAALSLASKLRSGESGAVERYLAFLEGGSSDSPIELLRAAGVDLSTPEPVVDAMKAFEATVAELEDAVNELGEDVRGGRRD